MRVLMISAGHPLPADNGAKRRILATAEFAARHHDLTLVSLRESASPAFEPRAPCWRDLVVDHPPRGRLWTAARSCLSRKSYTQLRYRNAALRSIVLRLLATEPFDCVWIHLLGMAAAVEPCFRGRWDGRYARPLFVLDQHNVDERYFRSFVEGAPNAPLRLCAALEAAKARHLQERWFPRFDVILCVAPEDVRESGRFVGPSTRIVLAPNGVDLDYFTLVPSSALRGQASVIVFGGSLDVTMNQDGVRWFHGSVLPHVRRRAPDVQLRIVGRSPPPDLRKLGEQRGTTLTGTVADVREHYRQAAVFVVPLRFGGGTKLKTLEAMAMGLPVVSTRVGAQGLDITSGRHLHVADDPHEFADRIVELLWDREKAVAMGAEARRLVEREYGWSAILGKVEAVLLPLLADRRAPTRRVVR